MRTRLRGVALAILLPAFMAGCATVPPEEDPVLLKLTELEQRLLRVESVVNNQSLLDLLAEVERLAAETRELRGQIETLQFQSDGAREQQRNLYADLDTRLTQLQQDNSLRVPPPRGADGADAATGGAPTESDRDVYRRAFALLQEGSYVEAGAEFDRFLTNFPDSSLRADAFYWRAETEYVNQQFEAALGRFERVLSDFPRSRKAPDALLKIGFCQYELGRYKAARVTLTRVREEHAETAAARLAIQRLAKMDDEGR